MLIGPYYLHMAENTYRTTQFHNYNGINCNTQYCGICQNVDTIFKKHLKRFPQHLSQTKRKTILLCFGVIYKNLASLCCVSLNSQKCNYIIKCKLVGDFMAGGVRYSVKNVLG